MLIFAASHGSGLRDSYHRGRWITARKMVMESGLRPTALPGATTVDLGQLDQTIQRTKTSVRRREKSCSVTSLTIAAVIFSPPRTDGSMGLA